MEELIVEATKPPSSGPNVEMRMAKRVRQSRAGSLERPSSSSAGDNLQLLTGLIVYSVFSTWY